MLLKLMVYPFKKELEKIGDDLVFYFQHIEFNRSINLMESPSSILQQYWGYQTFRPLQEEIITNILEGKDTLALLPTGGGKSICFQVPALANEGICLVISPLIALMKDQVENLKRKNIMALSIHSGMTFYEVKQPFQNAAFDP